VSLEKREKTLTESGRKPDGKLDPLIAETLHIGTATFNTEEFNAPPNLLLDLGIALLLHPGTYSCHR
jgi:hypothetical protein